MNTNISAASGHVMDVLFAISLFCVFAATCLVVLFIGAGVYRATVNEMERSYEISTSLSYVATRIRNHDVSGSVSVSELGGADALVLEREINGRIFQTWIYFYDGSLRELFIDRENTANLIAGLGQELISVYSFTFEKPYDNLVFITAQSADGVSARKLVGIRSE